MIYEIKKNSILRWQAQLEKASFKSVTRRVMQVTQGSDSSSTLELSFDGVSRLKLATGYSEAQLDSTSSAKLAHMRREARACHQDSLTQDRYLKSFLE